MATHIDSSQTMSAEKVQQTLIDTINKCAEKVVQKANYDKTILATIQYCTDATIGQYKIKYQDGYYTAYSQDATKNYSSGANVYVSVPGNNLNNRLFIIGSASIDSSQKVYTRNLEGDQQFALDGSNYITDINSDINMSSYWGTTTEYSLTLWSADSTNNLISFKGNVNELLQDAQYIRFGASFRTDLAESRKSSGDYGLILVLSYKKDDGTVYTKNYSLNTFNMIGSPFNYSSYMPQYNYWEVDQGEFYRVESVLEYVKGFPAGTEPSADYRDIFVKDISLHKATKLYNSDNDTYKVEIISEDDWTFTGGSSLRSVVRASANLRVNGNPVTDLNQNLKYFWAKEDSSVNYVNHPKYNAYFGKGWYCLNTGNKVKYSNETLAELQEGNYTITQEDTSYDGVEAIEWNTTMKDIEISRTLCKGQKTRVKCIVVYENIPISSDIKEIINESGYYVKLEEVEDRTEFFNGIGSFSLVAGVFQDTGASAPSTSMTLDPKITYQWTEVDALGNEKAIPNDNIQDNLISNEYWEGWALDDNDPKDTEKLSDATVEANLDGNLSLELCKERYDYYIKQSQSYKRIEEPSADEKIWFDTCLRRVNQLLEKKLQTCYDEYISANNNVGGDYVLGPSTVVGAYADAAIPNYRSATIESSTNIFKGESGYVERYNTLYKIPASKISTNLTYKVTALLTETIEQVTNTQEIGSEYITLINNPANLTDYNLQIVNGKQTFMYSNAGIAPTISAGSEHPVIIRPLTFKLFNKEGFLIFDSEDPDNEEFSTNITELHPVWRFNDTNSSLLKTNYKGAENTTPVIEGGVAALEVNYESRFVYSLADSYDVNKKESSNVLLSVNYQGMVITASTDFTFVKQGDLGTNGTTKILEIEDPTYSQYRSLVLTDDKYSEIKDIASGNNNYYFPQQRHLSNTYLYATNCYDENFDPVDLVSSARYVNLKFAQAIQDTSQTTRVEDGKGVAGTSSITLYGYWNENGKVQAIGSDSEWDTEVYDGYYKGTYYYSVPSFSIRSDSTSASAILDIDYLESQQGLAYKPTKIEDYPYDGGEYERVANNLIKVKATQTRDISSEEVEDLVNWGYYPIPYYYFNWTGRDEMPDYVDPARHIVVTGGFDQVVYDEKGMNPVYNQQEPFKFFMFDENNKDITDEVLKGALSEKTQVRWEASFGFSGSTSVVALQEVKNFPNDFTDNTEQLYGQYCYYQNKLYKCITPHTKGQKVEIKNGKGEVIKTYTPGQFVTPYWEEQKEEVNKAQEYKLTPAATYDTLAQSSLFNGWVHLSVQYKPTQNKRYDAEVLIPINVICNKYGSDILNGWDGKKTTVDDAYLISPQVAAGEKSSLNTFTGITIGKTFYPNDTTKHDEIGMFGYGHTDGDNTNPNSWRRTSFIDANTGRAIFGPSGASQIILNPVENSWSKLSGWYFRNDMLYKPVGENSRINVDSNKDFTALSQGYNIAPPAAPNGSCGLYSPWNTSASYTDVFLWASTNEQDLDDDLNPSTGQPVKGRATTYSNFNTNTANNQSNFYVTYGGHLHAASADIAGTIVAKAGKIGVNTDNNYIEIAVTHDNKKYLLYNKNFWVGQVDQNDDSDNAFGAFLKGRLMANSGMFGNITKDSQGQYPDGTSPRTLFINYKWYPWHLPGPTESWSGLYLDTSQGRNHSYALYHKNFYVDYNGEVFMNGKLFTKSGRIGDWVIDTHGIKSTNGNLWLYSSGPTEEEVGLHLGAFHANGSGAIRGSTWNITADGRAYFTNPANQFAGSSFTVIGGGGAGGISMGLDGLWLQAGQRINLGGNASTGPTGYIAAGDNSLLIYCSTGVRTSDDLAVGRTLRFGSASGGYGAMWLNKDGIYFNGSQGSYKIDADTGDAKLNDVQVNSLIINGVSITEYIRQKVQELIVNNLPSTVVTSVDPVNWDSFMRHNGGSHDYWGIGLTGIQAKTEDIPSRIDYPTED